MKIRFPVIVQLPNGEKLFIRKPKDLPLVYEIIEPDADDRVR